MEEDQLQYIKLGSLKQMSDEKIHSSETRAAQLAVADLVIQGIVYNQALQPSAATVLQGRLWVPFCLSASVYVAFFMTFATTVRDCLKTKRQRDAIFMEQEELHRKIRNGQKQNDSASSSSSVAAASGRRRLAEAFQYVRFKRNAYTWVVSIALHLFNLVVMYALSDLSFHRKISLV